jgi:hypothetical protein
MFKQRVLEGSVAVRFNPIRSGARYVLAAAIGLLLCGRLACSAETPNEVFLDPAAVQTVRSLYQKRDDTLRPKIHVITRFYAEILPDRIAKKVNVDRAQRALAEKKRSHRGNLFGADPTVKAAHDALASASAALAQDHDYEQILPDVAETQAQIGRIYLELRGFVPKSPNDPLIDAVTGAFESGCDSPYAPIEAHLLSAMSAIYGGNSDAARNHLQTIQSEQLFSKWPNWPSLTADFCVTCTLLDRAEICRTQQKVLDGWSDESDNPHVLWGIAMCKALSQKKSAEIYFRKAAAADGKGEIPATLMESILFDCLAYTAFSRQTLPKRLKEISGNQVLQESGLSQALFARAALAEDNAQKEKLLQEGLRRCPPDTRKLLEASFRLRGEPAQDGEVRERKVAVGID